MYSNLFYFRKISAIGGTEQFLYEIAKKYHKYSIVVVYDDADPLQLERLNRYVKTLHHRKGTKIRCKRAFFNFNLDAIDDIESTENYYCFVSHARYLKGQYEPPISHPKLNHFIGVSQFSTEGIELCAKDNGISLKAETCYNPLTLEKPRKIVRLVTASRLGDPTKGGNRVVKLIEALDEYAQSHNLLYVMDVFSNNNTDIKVKSENVNLHKGTINVRDYIADSDWYVQLSNDMETYCYSLNEAWGYGIHTISTPLSVINELNVPECANKVLNFDLSNISEVVEEIFKPQQKFVYSPPNDGWDEILNHDANQHQGENMYFKVKAKKSFESITDNTIGRPRKENEQWIVDAKRLKQLQDYPSDLIEIVEELEEPKVVFFAPPYPKDEKEAEKRVKRARKNEVS